MTSAKRNRSNIKEKFISSIDNIISISQGEPCEISECFDINRIETDKLYSNISSIVTNISQGESREINNSAISQGGYNFVAQKQGFGWISTTIKTINKVNKEELLQ